MTQQQPIQSIIDKLTTEHLQLLEVCRSYPTTESGIFCGEWIMHQCERQGVPFHQARLTKLANLGLLEKVDTSRGGHRRYYRIANAALVDEVLSLTGAER